MTDRTISIPVSAAMHVVIGCVIALLALTAFFVYAQLPNEHDKYRSGALALGIVAAVAALTYWLWCTSQCLRADVRANAVAIEDARAEIRTAKAEVLARLDGLAGRLDSIADETAQNRGSIKELTDTADQTAAALDKVAKAMKALQECYLQEGTIPAPRKDQDRETWLGTTEGPAPGKGAGPVPYAGITHAWRAQRRLLVNTL